MPKVLEFCDHPNYLYRGTTLLAINALASVVSSEVIDSTLLPIVLRMESDGIPNIRFKVAKTLGTLAQFSDSTVIQNRIRPALDTLLTDSDKDVRYYAQNAIKAIPPQPSS